MKVSPKEASRLFNVPVPMNVLTVRRKKLRKNLTSSEKRLRQLLLQKYGSGRVSFQMVFGWYILDFVFIEKLLVVELDGSSHNGREEYDRRRDRWLENHGVEVLRFSNSVVWKQPELILQEIERRPAKDRGVITFNRLRKAALEERQKVRSKALRKAGLGYTRTGRLCVLKKTPLEELGREAKKQLNYHGQIVVVKKGRLRDSKGRTSRPDCPLCGAGLSQRWQQCGNCHATINWIEK